MPSCRAVMTLTCADRPFSEMRICTSTDIQIYSYRMHPIFYLAGETVELLI